MRIFNSFLDMINKFENLPNEILLNIFQYLNLRDLFHGFWLLNQRINQLIRSMKNFSFKIEDNQTELLSLFAHQISRLTLNTSDDIDFNQFHSLHSLILEKLTPNQYKQIRSKSLSYLSFAPILSDYNSIPELTQQIFSNGFPTISHVNLGCIYIPYHFSWSQSPSLVSISTHCAEALIIPYILHSCPNLLTLKVYFIRNDIGLCHKRIPITNHSLQEFHLIDFSQELSFDDIDMCLSSMSEVKRMNLEFLCNISLKNLLQCILNRVKDLERFNCHIQMIGKNTITMENIREMHPCFQNIQYVEDSRLFTTRRNER